MFKLAVDGKLSYFQYGRLIPRPHLGGTTDTLHIPAFNIGELGAMLLKETEYCYFHKPSGLWSHASVGWNTDHTKRLFDTQAECYADRLLYLLTLFPVKYPAEFMNTRLKNFYDLKRVA